MRKRSWLQVILCVLLLIGAAIMLASGSAAASPPSKVSLSTPIPFNRPGPPPTVYPPAQAENGAQVFWGMCQDCHGDQGQGLTAEWRATFPPEYQDCWASGCHGEGAPANSFVLPETGGPVLAGPGALPQFLTAFDLGIYIQQSMPLYPPGSLSEDQAWELTSFLVNLNDKNIGNLTLSGNNSAAIPIHHNINIPESELPGTLLFSLFLVLAAVGISLGKRKADVESPNNRKGNFYHHLHPPRIPANQARLIYTLGAGGLAVFFSLILLITGALEALSNRSPSSA